METIKQLGIWMDHSSAHLMDFTTDAIETKIITSKFTLQEKGKSLSKGKNLMHNKEQYQQSEYYKNLANVIKNYNEVILFGSTHAKTELLNTLRADLRFIKIKIDY
jgi:nitrogenase subunit NifH